MCFESCAVSLYIESCAVSLQAKIPQRNVHLDVLHLRIRNSNNIGDIAEHIYQSLLKPSFHPRNLLLDENRLDKWALSKSHHSTRQPAEWLVKGADVVQCAKEVTVVEKPITGRIGGQCVTLDARVDELWDRHEHTLSALSQYLARCSPQLEKLLKCIFQQCPIDKIPHYLQLAMDSCRRVNIECASAHPDIAKLEQAVHEYVECVSYFSHKCMLRPVRYAVKTYDHIAEQHVVDCAGIMERDRALSMGAVSSGALESLSKVFKSGLRRNVGGGRLDATHEHANDRFVRTFVVMSGDLRCMRKRAAAEITTTTKTAFDSHSHSQIYDVRRRYACHADGCCRGSMNVVSRGGVWLLCPGCFSHLEETNCSNRR